MVGREKGGGDRSFYIMVVDGLLDRMGWQKGFAVAIGSLIVWPVSEVEARCQCREAEFETNDSNDLGICMT